MNFQLRFPLRDLLRGATTGEYTEVQLRELHRLAYSLARHLVRRKIASGKLRLNLIGLSESDITHDCIAELFTRDENGVLVEIKKFFHDQQIFIEEMPDEALLIQFRRLTFTMVKDGVFRLYHEADPTLAKILRNLKAALGKSPTWSIADRFDEQYAEVISTPTHTNLPSIDDDELERFLCQIMAKTSDLSYVIHQLAEALLSERRYRTRVRLMSLAQAIKIGYEIVGWMEVHETDDGLTLLFDDVRSTIREVRHYVETTMKSGYVDGGKVSKELFASYMDALEKILHHEFIDGMDGETSYFECLRYIRPSLSKDEYRTHHRTIFEYLVKLAKKETRVRLQAQ